MTNKTSHLTLGKTFAYSPFDFRHERLSCYGGKFHNFSALYYELSANNVASKTASLSAHRVIYYAHGGWLMEVIKRATEIMNIQHRALLWSL